VVRTGSHPGRNPDVGRLQEKGRSPTATATTASGGSNGFNFGETEQHSGWAIRVADMANLQRH